MLLMKRLGFLFMIFLAAASERDAQAQTVDAVRDYTMVIEPLSTECERVRNPGDLCSPTLDVVYLGDGVSGRKLFTTFLALPSTAAWNAGNATGSSMIRTDLLSSIFGASNGATLAWTDSSTAAGFQFHNAAFACDTLAHGQYDDWYLPAAGEAYSLFRARAHISASNSTVWTSTEVNQTFAMGLSIGTGPASAATKSTSRTIQCVRSGASPSVASKDCSSVITIGETCVNDNISFAGPGPSGGGLFTTPFTLPATTWNSGLTTPANMLRTGVQSGINGAANSATLAVADADLTSGTQIHLAADVCQTMTYGGYDDWYLPAAGEASLLYLNRASLPVQSGTVWTSTEVDNAVAHAFAIGAGTLASTTKSTGNPVMCVRKQAVSSLTPTPCEGVAALGGVCGNGDVVMVIESIDGGHLFAASFHLAATFWNDGNTTSANMLLTNINSRNTGRSNTATLATADSYLGSGIQIHSAAEVCQSMTLGGYSDWYLPASFEVAELTRNLTHTPVKSGIVWTSTEVGQSSAMTHDVGTGALAATTKSTRALVQCVRRGPVPITPTKPCGTVTALGETCGTGNLVYAGKAPSGGDMFTTSFLMPVTTWNSGLTTAANMLRTNVQSGINGAENSATLSVADADLTSGTQIHAAADVCQNMTHGGYDDWYLPGSAEARTLFLNRSSLPVQSGTIWTSSEVSNSTAREFNIGTGALLSTTKSSTRALLCVRKETVPGLVNASDCGTASVNGQACANGSVRFVGVDGGRKVYTTAFQFPNSFWNGGLTTSANMLATNQRSLTDGSLNTAAIAVADADLTSGTQTHNAASICDQLNVGGFADWYLPAITEAEFLYANRAGLPTIGAIWSSTEAAASTAISLTALGARSTLGKATELNVQCVRRNP